VRERGVQSRRVRPGGVGPASRNGPPAPTRGNIWQAIAIVALIAATAGWTTVAVLALRPASGAAAQASPSDVVDASASDDTSSEPPVADTHDAVEMEALLPTLVSGSTLQTQSWTGDTILGDDTFSTAMTKFLTDAGKTSQDMRVAQAYDPTQTLDITVTAYRVAGVKAAAIRDALIAAWKVDYPDLKVTTVTLADKQVTKADFGQDAIASYLYLQDDVVFDIESGDETLATAAIAALPKPGASPSGGASARPSSSPIPSRTAPPAPSPS
jgi:hypothetical protein